MADADPNRCPYCGADYGQPFVVCTQCGMNRKTGRMYEPTVVEEDDEEPQPSRWMRTLLWSAEYVPGLFRPLVLIAAIILAVLGLGITLMGVVLLVGFGVILGSMAVIAIGSLAYAQAVAWVLWGELGFLTDQLVDFDETRWMMFFVGLVTPGIIFLTMAVYYSK